MALAVSDEIRLGQYRDSMVANPLLRKAELGKPMQRGFELPGKEFIYGRPNHCIDGGAQEAMQYTVLEHNRIRRHELAAKSGQKRRKNFVKRNILCVQNGLVTAKEQASCGTHFDTDIYLINPPELANKPNSLNTVRSRRCPPDTTFGISTRPSTPVFELLEHRYQTKWLQNQQKKQDQNNEVAKKNGHGRPYKTQTKVQQLMCELQHKRRTEYEKGNEKLWQMPRFQQTGPHLKTFRSESVRERSFREHEAQRNTKQGFLGQGISIEYG